MVGEPNLNIESPKIKLKEIFYENWKVNKTFNAGEVLENYDSYY